MKEEDLVYNLWYPNLQAEEGELYNNGTNKRHKTD